MDNIENKTTVNENASPAIEATPENKAENSSAKTEGTKKSIFCNISPTDMNRLCIGGAICCMFVIATIALSAWITNSIIHSSQKTSAPVITSVPYILEVYTGSERRVYDVDISSSSINNEETTFFIAEGGYIKFYDNKVIIADDNGVPVAVYLSGSIRREKDDEDYISFMKEKYEKMKPHQSDKQWVK